MATRIHLANVNLLPKTKELYLHKLVDHLFSNRKSPNFANTPRKKGRNYAKNASSNGGCNDRNADLRYSLCKSRQYISTSERSYQRRKLCGNAYPYHSANGITEAHNGSYGNAGTDSGADRNTDTCNHFRMG
jgi:hypothetical protein